MLSSSKGAATRIVAFIFTESECSDRYRTKNIAPNERSTRTQLSADKLLVRYRRNYRLIVVMWSINQQRFNRRNATGNFDDIFVDLA